MPRRQDLLWGSSSSDSDNDKTKLESPPVVPQDTEDHDDEGGENLLWRLTEAAKAKKDNQDSRLLAKYGLGQTFIKGNLWESTGLATFERIRELEIQLEIGLSRLEKGRKGVVYAETLVSELREQDSELRQELQVGDVHGIAASGASGSEKVLTLKLEAENAKLCQELEIEELSAACVMSQLQLEERLMQQDIRHDQAEMARAEVVIQDLQELGVVTDATFPALKEALWERQAVSIQNADLRSSLWNLTSEAEHIKGQNIQLEEELGASRAEIAHLELSLGRPKQDLRRKGMEELEVEFQKAEEELRTELRELRSIVYVMDTRSTDTTQRMNQSASNGQRTDDSHAVATESAADELLQTLSEPLAILGGLGDSRLQSSQAQAASLSSHRPLAIDRKDQVVEQRIGEVSPSGRMALTPQASSERSSRPALSSGGRRSRGGSRQSNGFTPPSPGIGVTWDTWPHRS